MTTINDHFDTKNAVVKEIYEKVLQAARSVGEFTVDPMKTAIYLRATRAFLGIYPKKEWLDVGFVFETRKKDKRFRAIGKISKNRYNHQMRLISPKQVDDAFTDYLRESYEVKSK